jgi:adenosylhomocysteine nucleosidase
MANNFTNTTYVLKESLLVFALLSEAAGEFDEYHRLITGVGKVNAAYELTKRIVLQKPKLIINLGSAGSNVFNKGEVVCCTKFIQRDMDARGLGFKQFETPFSSDQIVLVHGLKVPGVPEAICGTGDSFETAHSLGNYNVIDMEGYPLAFVAMKEKIPFLSLKYISDGADGSAAEDWTVEVHKAAKAFKELFCSIGPVYNPA